MEYKKINILILNKAAIFIRNAFLSTFMMCYSKDPQEKKKEKSTNIN